MVIETSPFSPPPKRTKGFQAFPNRGEEAIGVDGETLFKKWLDENNLPYKWGRLEKNYRERTPGGGFVVDWDFNVNGHLVEVKTVDASTYKTKFMIPTFQDNKCGYYVGIKLPDKLCGYLTRTDVLQLPINDWGYSPAYWTELQNMKPIEDLLKTLKPTIMRQSTF